MTDFITGLCDYYWSHHRAVSFVTAFVAYVALWLINWEMALAFTLLVFGIWCARPFRLE